MGQSKQAAFIATSLAVLISAATAAALPTDPTITQIVTGAYHSCALTSAGGVKCWGSDSSLAPVDVPSLTSGVVSLAAGTDFTCALTGSGGVKCWGNNGDGQLGNSSTSSPTPSNVSGLSSGVASLSAGVAHVCALTTAGGVKCWGRNSSGQLGDGTTTSRRHPVDVTDLTSGVIAVSAGSAQTCAVTSSAGVKCWGHNLGMTDVSGATTGILTVAAGYHHACALTTAGGAKCWGDNSNGQVGDGTNTARTVATDVVGLTSGVARLSVGYVHSGAVTTGGSVKGWGANFYGQLGDGTTTRSYFPVDAVGLATDVTDIAAGFYHKCVLTRGGGVKCWGDNYNGQLGDGTRTGRTVATDVTGLGQSAPSITFSAPTVLAAGDSVTLSAASTSGLPVTFDTWTPDTCTVTGNTLTATASAVCGVRASQAGDGTTAPAPQQLRLIPITGARVPTVTSPSVASLTPVSVSLGGSVLSDGGATITDRGIVYSRTSLNADPRIGGASVIQISTSGTTGAFSTPTTGLTPSTGYSFRAYAATSLGTGYTSIETFTTSSFPPAQITAYAGDNQSAPAGSLVAIEPSVMVTDAYNNPIPGVVVTFSVTSGGGVAHPLVRSTDERGITSGIAWRLGPSPGSNVLTAVATGLTQSPVAFTASAYALTQAPGVTLTDVGDEHACALTAAGAVRCWGSDVAGQLGGGGLGTFRSIPVEVLGLTRGIVSISTGGNHTCALTLAGGVKCWGKNDRGQLGDGTTTTQPRAVDVAGLGSGVAGISAGQSHTCALMTTGGVKCWGGNGAGALGDGTLSDRHAAVDVVGLSGGVAEISAGDRHTCARTTAGGLKCWGDNSQGQLGDGSINAQTVPTDVSGLSSGVAAVSAGGSHTCAVTNRGGTKCWGSNARGQIGDGTTSSRAVPTDVAGLSDGIRVIAAGTLSTCALTTGGGAKCWGHNENGAVGDGTTTQRTTPVDVTGLANGVASLAVGGGSVCALSRDGGVRCWGHNTLGRLGDGTTTSRTAAVEVATLSGGVAGVSAGLYHSCALGSGGALRCWGDNLDGQLGDGTTTSRLSAVEVLGFTSAAISTGGYHSCAVTTEGGAKCWGYNGVGGLGNGTFSTSWTPVNVAGLTSGVRSISGGLYQTCAVTSSGSAKCWGNNANGQLGDGTTTTRPSAGDVTYLTGNTASIATGDFHSCAVTTGGAASCWGSNLNGKLGDGTTTPRTRPGDVTGLGGGVAGIGAGAQHSCALTTGGAVLCWGRNSEGQLGDGTTQPHLTPAYVTGLTSGVTSLSVGSYHNCVVMSGGGARCWGHNGDGQLGDGTTTPRATPVEVAGLSNGVASIAAGGFHTCATTTRGGARCWGYNGYGGLGNGTIDRQTRPVLALPDRQSITFTSPASLIVGTTTTLSASATSGLAVVFDTWTPDTCSVTGNSVTTTVTGLCGIRVSQPGDIGVAAASQQMRLIPVTPPTAPVLAQPSSSAITITTATLGGMVMSDGGSPITTRGVVFAPTASNPDPQIGGPGVILVSTDGTTGPFAVGVTGLAASTHYSFRAYATNALGTGYTPVASFTNVVTMSIADTAVPEGYLSGSTMNFAVSLSIPAPGPVSVLWATQPGSATPGSDYTSASGILTFAAGESRKVIGVSVLGDAIAEPNRTFLMNLSSPNGAVLGQATATGTILNDDGPTISVTDVRITEGTGAGTTNLTFTVITSQASTSPITIQYATADGTATAGSDYTAAAGTLTLLPNYPSGIVSVPVTRDSTIEPNETVLLNLLSATGATISDHQGVGTIEADDGLLVSIADKTSHEGDIGVTPITFTLTLNSSAHSGVTVDWATAPGTATAPLDYTTASGTVTFAAGETSKTATVQIVGDTGKEAYETFFVDLSNATGGAAIGDERGQGTITNTDGSTDRSRLMFHNFVTNRLYRWHMRDGNTLDTFNWVTPWSTDAGWTVGAVADFDQDGQLDYLWHNTDDGRMLFWYIDGDNLKGFQFLPYSMGPPWRVATTFDADGNGTPDIVYYNSTTGVVRVVRHDNATVLGQDDVTTLLPGAGTVRVVASVDANNDGDDELALYNSVTGEVSAWDITGATVTGTINYANTQSTTQAFNLVSTKTDFNDDGFADFLWHNPTPTGVFSVWFMNGTTRLGVGQFQPFTATDPVWKVVGSANVW